MQLEPTAALARPDGTLEAVVGVVVSDGTATTRRVIVPAALPCGECGRCRRALTVACERVRFPFGRDVGATALGPRVEVTERFATALDGTDAQPLSDPAALAAAPVARVLDALGRIGVGPGDLVAWVGEGTLVTAGAALCSHRGARVFVLAFNRPATLPESVQHVTPDEAPAVLAQVEASTPGGFLERKLLVGTSEPALIQSALALVTPGTAASFMAPIDRLTVAPSPSWTNARLVFHDGFHPDFLPEALAAVRKNEVDPERLVAAIPNRPSGLALFTASC